MVGGGAWCSSDHQQRPGTPWDIALLGAAIAASVPFVGANVVVAAWMRDRKYVVAQGGPALILTSSACGLLWIASSFVTNLHFARTGTLLHFCSLWSFWLQLTFGFWLWLVCIIIRLYRLYSLVNNAPCSWVPLFLLLWIPALAFSILATAKQASTMQDGCCQDSDVTPGSHECANCHLAAGWKLSTFIILPVIYFLVVVVLLFRSKGQTDYMLSMEYSHTSEYTLMAFVIFLLYGVTLMTRSELRTSGRCFLTFCICCLVFCHFWVRMGWPVYLCCFKGESELDNFEEELRCCGAECFDKINNPSGSSAVFLERTSFSVHDGDWILRATDAAMTEFSECKQRIKELEEKKVLFSTRIKELEKLTRRAGPVPSLSTNANMVQ